MPPRHAAPSCRPVMPTQVGIHACPALIKGIIGHHYSNPAQCSTMFQSVWSVVVRKLDACRGRSRICCTSWSGSATRVRASGRSPRTSAEGERNGMLPNEPRSPTAFCQAAHREPTGRGCTGSASQPFHALSPPISPIGHRLKQVPPIRKVSFCHNFRRRRCPVLLTALPFTRPTGYCCNLGSRSTSQAISKVGPRCMRIGATRSPLRGIFQRCRRPAHRAPPRLTCYCRGNDAADDTIALLAE